MKLTPFVFLIWIGSASAWAASPFNYFAQIPKTGLSCNQEASNLGVRFTQATHLQVTRAQCAGEPVITSGGKSHSFYSLSLDYLADSEVEPYVASIGTNPNAALAESTDYSTFEECKSDLNKQSVLFAQETKLLAVSATCSPTTPDSEDQNTRYSVFIQSFGEPVKQLRYFQIATEGAPNSSYFTKATSILSSLGATIVRTSHEGGISYYSGDVLSLNQVALAHFSELSQCRQQIESANQICSATGATHFVSDCLPSLSATDGFSLEAVYDSYSLVSTDFGMHSPRYPKFQECMSDRARAVRAVSESQGQPSLGGICEPDLMTDGQYRLDTFVAE